jgi:kynurenine formamidase
VLLDYHAWRKQTGKPVVAANTTFSISTDELDQVAEHQGVEFRDGDILIIRSGFTVWYEQAGKEERETAVQQCTYIGVEASMQSVKWLYNHHFAAVAGDTIAFESQPIHFNVEGKPTLHEWLLGHWGTPIGELWDLERLSRVCQERKQWSFLFTSAPLNVFGGVGSPPNAVAIL